MTMNDYEYNDIVPHIHDQNSTGIYCKCYCVN
jgi:hypothetical protein